MRIFKTLLYLLLLGGAVYLTSQLGSSVAQPSTAEIVPGQVIVVWEQEKSNSLQALGDLGLQSVDSVVAEQFEGSNFSLVAVTPGTEEAEAVRISGLPGVLLAQPDGYGVGIDGPFPVPSDTLYPQQVNVLQHNLENAFRFTNRENPATIAVVDGGWPFVGHPDEPTSLTIGPTYDSGALCSHGAVIATTAAPINGVGSVGTCPFCKIVSIKSGHQEGDGLCHFSTSSFVAGINYAANQTAVRVINLSVAFPPSEAGPINAATSAAINKGKVVVSGAANTGQNQAFYPCRSPGVMCASALAPDGVNLHQDSTWGDVDAALTGQVYTVGFNGTWVFQGRTSHATAQLSGIFGQLFSQNPALTRAQAESAILSTATPLGDPAKFGAGRPNLSKALGVDVLGTVNGLIRGNVPPLTPLAGWPVRVGQWTLVTNGSGNLNSQLPAGTWTAFALGGLHCATLRVYNQGTVTNVAIPPGGNVALNQDLTVAQIVSACLPNYLPLIYK